MESLENRDVPAITFSVNVFTDLPDANPGDGFAKDANNQTSLRAAIMEGNALLGTHNSVTINFVTPTTEEGTPPLTILLGTALPSLNNNFTITGAGASLLTVQRDPNAGNFRIFHVSPDRTCIINSMTMTGGNVTGVGVDGGGIRNQGSLSLTSVVMYGNTSGEDGGAIFNSGSLSASLCSIHDNSVSLTTSGCGGGIASWGGSCSLYECDVYNNSAYYGGGLCINSGTASVTQSTDIYSNSARYGGGIHIWDCTSFTMSGGSIEDNGADEKGGGLFVDDGSNISLSGVSITENEASGVNGKGGGFYVENGWVTFTNCDLIDNTATVLGDGGSYLNGGYTRSGGTWSDTITGDL